MKNRNILIKFHKSAIQSKTKIITIAGILPIFILPILNLDRVKIGTPY